MNTNITKKESNKVKTYSNKVNETQSRESRVFTKLKKNRAQQP
jgi:hypothetical protein